MKKIFELWLDESGDFKNERKKLKRGHNPSHIAGILVEKGAFGKGAVERIFPEKDGFHSNEADREESMKRFRMIEKKAEEIRQSGKYVRYVVFTNSECIVVLDDKITYQNIMAEGIVKVIRDLKAGYGDIKLEILIAKKPDETRPHTDGSVIIGADEYKEKLSEKLIMAGYRARIDQNEWSLETASAKRLPQFNEKLDKRLVVADVLSNCFLTRTTKFKGEESKEICAIYGDKEKTKVSSVLSFSMENQFKDLMAAGRIGEAVASICQCDVPEVIAESMESIRQRLNEMGDKDIELQYSFLKALFERYLNMEQSYAECEKVLKNLSEYFIPVLGERETAKKLAFDLNFYLFTVYTHMGNVDAAEVAEQKCEELSLYLPTNWNMVELRIKFELRKVIHLINLFDYSRAKEMNENLIRKCREIKEVFSLYKEDVTYDELAKALGTKVQIDMFTLRNKGKNSEDYTQAVSCSNEAIREFVSQSDIARQYLYRVQLETEAGEYDKAYQYLCLAGGFDENADVGVWLQELKMDNRIYQISAYVRLMAEGKLSGWEMADQMYEILVQSGVIKGLLAMEKKEHPAEIILWKYACYLSLVSKKSPEAYKNAMELCFDSNDLTLNIIGLAIELEQYAFALRYENKKEKQQYKKALQKRFSDIYERRLPDSMKSVFGEVDFEEESWEYYYNLSRRVTY